MLSPLAEAIVLVQALKESLKKAPLASFEEADYFRKHYKKPAPSPTPIQTPLPPPLLIAAPTPTAPALPTPVPMTAPITPPSSSLFSLLPRLAPAIHLISSPPPDERAKKRAERWKTKNQSAPISLLSFGEPPEHQRLLSDIAVALDTYFGPATLIFAESIEKEKQWEAFLSSPNLKWILTCDYTLWQMHDLVRFFREVPATQTRTLGKIPLFLLPDLSLYLKDPLLKRSLWKGLCQTISSL